MLFLLCLIIWFVAVDESRDLQCYHLLDALTYWADARKRYPTGFL